jgi:valyl-tRNA synthetase
MASQPGEFSADDLPSRYDPAASDPGLYASWESAGVFQVNASDSARTGGKRDPFVIVMPPPNVTGVLHMGHGLNNTVQDVLIRWRRMSGDASLWQPGTDHAGIATQNVVEKVIAKEGKTRGDLGREPFIERVKEFVVEKGGVILKQLRAIGVSADWNRTAYTFSPELSRAVREIFVQWYEDGLIYRGHRVTHWCSRCLTALSDEEAESHPSQGLMYHIRYVAADDPSMSVVVATTRPETMFGDVAVAVHPADDRYASLVGKQVVNPANGLSIPVIADDYVDREFGTGALKITPAHDANDFEVGRRHKLSMPIILTPEGALTEGVDAEGRVPAEYRGLDRFDARKKVAKALEAKGALVKTEQHHNAVRKCYRCDTVVEPRLSDQWFVKMAPLAAPALQALKDGHVRILPERWEAVYVNWMENIRDWNISRQIWWGHRVPVFYCLSPKPGCPAHFASRDDAPVCTGCGGATRQDDDVLDTWFSSQLWPFSTFGWPDKTKDLAAFYPTDVLVTAPEILFFWVARMIMSGMYVTRSKENPSGIAPFHTVYLHGTARDAQHRRMSKSLGNGIDPLDVVEAYGADALRWTVIAGMGLGNDLLLDHENIEGSFSTGRNFATKLWNIGRFLLLQVGSEKVKSVKDVAANLAPADHWILSRLDEAIAASDAAIGPARPSGNDRAWTESERRKGLRLDEYAEAARAFVWSDLADWYLEHAKTRLQLGHADRETARAILVHAFDQALRLLHPIMPFVTEALWQKLPDRAKGEWLASAAWPRAGKLGDVKKGSAFDTERAFATAIREIKSQYAIPHGQSVQATITGSNGHASLFASPDFVQKASGAVVVKPADVRQETAARRILSDGSEVLVALEGVVDFAKEREKLSGELEGLTKQLAALRGRLSNEKFTAKAPPAIVEAERTKEREWAARAEQLATQIANLGGA